MGRDEFMVEGEDVKLCINPAAHIELQPFNIVGKKWVWLLAGSEELRRRRNGLCRHKRPWFYSITKSKQVIQK